MAVLADYPAKFETLKMRVTANSPFNVNYEIAIKCIKLNCIDTSKTVLMNDMK